MNWEQGNDGKLRGRRKGGGGDWWKSLIELLFQVWIYFTDPTLVCTHTCACTEKCVHVRAFAYTPTKMLLSSLESFIKASNRASSRTPMHFQ